MKKYEFDLILDRIPTDAEIDLLYENGFDSDGIVIGPRGSHIMVLRKGKTRDIAIGEAVRQLEACGFQAVNIRKGTIARPGRPSLSHAGNRSPQVNVVLPLTSKEALAAMAKQRGVKKSDLVRQAIDEFMEREMIHQAA